MIQVDTNQLVADATRIMDSFLHPDDKHAFSLLERDFFLDDPQLLFAGDIHRFRRFLRHVSAGEGAEFNIGLWGYSTRSLQYRISFTSPYLRQKSSQESIIIRLKLYLSSEGKAAGFILSYNPKHLISALSLGLIDRCTKIILYNLGQYRLGE